MKNRLRIMVLIVLIFTACKTPNLSERQINNDIKSIVISEDSSMINPMNPVSDEKLILDSDLTLSFGSKKIKVTKAQFNNIIKSIKFIDISKLKEIKHQPTLGASYKSVSIKTDKKSYQFSSDNSRDYPRVISNLVRKIYKLKSLPTQSSDNQWHRLKLLKGYLATDFKLKNGVEYLEIRIYTKGQKKSIYSEKYTTAVVMQQTPLEFFDAKLLKNFKNVHPNFSNETDIKRTGFCLMSGCVSMLGNGVMIDSNKKIWSMNTTDDILDMIGEVDTPAEAKLILWLNDKRMVDVKEDIYKYRKNPNGYEILYEYDNSISNMGECGHFLYELFITKDGKITKKKLLKKSESKNGCLAVD